MIGHFSKGKGFRIASAVAILALAAFGSTQGLAQGKKSQVAIGVTETISSHNPHGDSISLGYGIWCQVYGCLGTYDFEKGEYVGMLAESWEVDQDDPRIWTFHLRKGLKRHNDGHELTAEDVVHSINRMANDPQTRQKQNVRNVAKIEAVDKYTVRITTDKPTAPLLEYLFDRVMITSKDLHEKHGARTADRKYPWGWGPYELKDLAIGQRIVLEKAPDNTFAKAGNPDTLIFSIMREAEQRVTALLNREIQIAQFVPPHLAPRIEQASGADIVPTNSVEIMFLAMRPDSKPFDSRLLRRAVCHAINKDAIIKAILQDQAQRLDGPIGPGQYAYDAAATKKMMIPYDPEKGRALVKEAGLEGAEVTLYTPVGRYVNDKQATEAMIPMLNEIGLRAQLATPEWPTLWSNVQKGKVPFYYMGRGSVVDPSVAFAQYFETGGSPRIGISDPEIDKYLQTERQTFDPTERKKILNQAFAEIMHEAPACFMWRHKLLYGVAKNVKFEPLPNARVFGTDIIVRN